jgi:hypothetical protein
MSLIPGARWPAVSKPTGPLSRNFCPQRPISVPHRFPVHRGAHARHIPCSPEFSWRIMSLKSWCGSWALSPLRRQQDPRPAPFLPAGQHSQLRGRATCGGPSRPGDPRGSTRPPNVRALSEGPLTEANHPRPPRRFRGSSVPSRESKSIHETGLRNHPTYYLSASPSASRTFLSFS